MNRLSLLEALRGKPPRSEILIGQRQREAIAWVDDNTQWPVHLFGHPTYLLDVPDHFEIVPPGTFKNRLSAADKE